MARATLPLNAKAVQAANAKVGAGRPLTNDPADAPLRAEWMREYQAAGGKVAASPGSAKPIASASQGCLDAPAKPPPKPSKPPTQKAKPCDLQSVTLTEIQATPLKGIVSQDGRVYSNENDPKKLIRKVQSSLGTSGPVFQVVAGRSTEPATQLALAVEAGPGYHDGAAHPAVIVSGGSVVKQYLGVAATNACKFPVFTTHLADEGPSQGLIETIRSYWPFGRQPDQYLVDVAVCGVRTDGKPVVGDRKLVIEVFPADTYMLVLAIPAYRKSKFEGRRMRGRKGPATYDKDTDTQWTPRGGERVSGTESESEHYHFKNSTTRTDDDGIVVTHTSDTKLGADRTFHSERETAYRLQGDKLTVLEDAEKPIELSHEAPTKVNLELRRNGVQNKNTLALTEIIDTAKSLERNFKELWNSIKEWAPQIGWGFEFETSFFSGEISLEWCHKEYQDHRVYSQLTGRVKVDVFAVDAKLSFGIRMSDSVVAKIEGSIAGKLGLDVKLDRDAPGKPWLPNDGSASQKTEIEVKLEGVVAVGPESFRFERRGGVRSGIDVSAEFAASEHEGLSLSYEIVFRAIELYCLKKDVNMTRDAFVKPLTDQVTARGDLLKSKPSIH